MLDGPANDRLSAARGDYSELEFRCSRFIRSSSFAWVSCRKSSASLASEVVNGPVGGRCPPGRRLSKLLKGFIGGKAYLERAFGLTRARMFCAAR